MAILQMMRRVKMESIDKISRIDRSKLSGEYYFQSLLEQAYHCGLLLDSDLERIQFDCLSILAKQTESYNSGDSSSIRIETAQNILVSVMYTIGMCLKTYTNPDDAVIALQNEKMETLFEEGRRQIDRMVNTTKILHSNIIQHLVDTQNVFYRSTVVDAIRGFFKLYYPEFGAQEIHITGDYPTCNGVSDLAGVEFIRKYLENIYCENTFCACFPVENIHHLLCGYHEDYQNLLFNIYEPVLTSALGCALVDKDIRALELSFFDITYLDRLFKNTDKSEIESILRQVLDKVKQALSLSDNLMNYLNDSISRIATDIWNSSRTHTTDKVFVIPYYPENDPFVSFSYGEKMDNDRYRKLVEEIMQCNMTEDKIMIIKEEINSFADFADILLDAEFSSVEIPEVLKLLNPVELAALAKKYPYQNDLEMLDMKENERLLCNCLKKFVNSLTNEEQKWIERMVKLLKLKEE